MKKTYSKIIALIVALASLISVFSVFSFAEESDSTVVDDGFDQNQHLIINRDFADGWEATNGFNSNLGKHTASIDYEIADDLSYNYFMRLEHTGDSKEGKLTLDLQTRNKVQKNGKFVVSLSVKADDLCDLGTILQIKLHNASSTIDLLKIDGYSLYVFDTQAKNFVASLEDGAWYDVAFLVDWTQGDDYTITAYVDGAEKSSMTNMAVNTGVSYVYFGFNALTKPEERAGMSVCMDNVSVYQAPNLQGLKDTSSYGEGIFVNRSLDKTVEIFEGKNQKFPEQILAEALFMKLGVDSAYGWEEKIEELTVAPAKVNGTVMVPLVDVLEYLEYPYYVHPDNVSYAINLPSGETTYLTLYRDNASVAGKTVQLAAAPVVVDGAPLFALEDVAMLFPGWNSVYDDMGLAIVYEDISNGESDEPFITRADDLDTMLEMMKKFIFDTVDDEALKADQRYTATGEKVYEAALQNSEFLHPYIFTNQEYFNELNAIYEATKQNETLKSYLDDAIEKADAIYSDMAKVEADAYAGIEDGKAPKNYFNDGDNSDVKDTDDGYNSKTGALYEIEEITAKLVDLAFAYQVTRDDKYMLLAYDMMIELGTWVHWAPGYMVNCATATSNFAIAYDWLYNRIKELKGDDAVANLAVILYEKGVAMAVRASRGDFCNFPRTSGHGDHYITRTDSYNAISASGMIIGALAIMDIVEYQADTFYLVGNNLRNLADYGLDQYAPDGSYIESVTYWALGTNALMKLIMALDSTTGDDFGFKDAWGINTTFYYACYIANGNGEAWGYHETGLGSILVADKLEADTQMFGYAGQIFGDDTLVAIRQNQLKNGKASTIFDILFYSDGVVDSDYEFELDYFMDGIDAFVTRSGWEKDSMFAGIMGGENSYSPYGNNDNYEKFGQIDSGNFIYENLGIKWFIDLGSEYYSVDRYFGDYRYQYYRNSAEGHNMMLVPDLQYGQNETGDGEMFETYVDPDGKGSYAKINNSFAYGDNISTAIRGLLVTNNRQTVVLQDEITRNSAGPLLWVAQTCEEIVIDETGSIAYLIHTDEEENKTILRATLVTSLEGVEFSVLESADTRLSGTRDFDSTQMPLDENLKRLAIDVESAISLTIAVVFEIVESTQSDLEVGYEWKNLVEWENYFKAEEIVNTVPKYEANTAMYEGLIDRAAVIYADYLHFTTGLSDFYDYLSHAKFICEEYNDQFHPEDTNESLYEEYVKFLDEYNEYRLLVVGSVRDITRITDSLSGR